MELKTLAVSERSSNQDILFDVTIISDNKTAGVIGDDLWKLSAGFQDGEGNEVNGSVMATIDLGDAIQNMYAGDPLVFENLQDEDVALSAVICPEVGRRCVR